MKKCVFKVEIVASICILLALLSCEKDQKPHKTQAEYGMRGSKKKVTFVVSGFTRSNLPYFSARAAAPDPETDPTDSITKYIDHLYFGVTRLTYEPVAYEVIESGVQTSADSAFGKFSSTLIPGRYHIILVGSRGPSYVPLSSESVSNFSVDYSVEETKDIFAGGGSVQVADSTSNVPLFLSRVVGQLEVQLEDAIPPECKRVEVTVHKEAKGFDLGLDQWRCSQVIGYYDRVVSRDVLPSDIGETRFKLQTMVVNTEDKYHCGSDQFITVEIKAFSGDGLLTEKDVNGLLFAEGVRIILRGALFHTSNDFSITLDTLWRSGKEFNF